MVKDGEKGMKAGIRDKARDSSREGKEIGARIEMGRQERGWQSSEDRDGN